MSPAAVSSTALGVKGGATPKTLVLLSARTRGELIARLDATIARWAPAAPPEPGPHPAAHPERLALVAEPEKMPAALASARQTLTTRTAARIVHRSAGLYYASGAAPGSIAFLFSGEGAQRPGMLGEARTRIADLNTWLDALEATYARHGEAGIADLLHGAESEDAQTRESRARRLYDIAHGGQLGTIANLGLCQMLGRLGVHPDMVAGHSNGEHAAALVAGGDTASRSADICAWLRRASRAGQALPLPETAEAMFAVGGASPDLVSETLRAHGSGAFMAMENCPQQCVIGGRETVVRGVIADLSQRRAVCSRLPFARAYHTPLFAEWQRVLTESYAHLPLRPTSIPFISSFHASAVGPHPDAIRKALGAQWTDTVRFRDTVAHMYDRGARTFIEVGCDDKLTAFVQDTLRGRVHMAGAMLSSRTGEMAQVLRLLALLHIQGIALAFEGLAQVLGRAPASRVGPGGGARCPDTRRRTQDDAPQIARGGRAGGQTLARQRALVARARQALASGPVREDAAAASRLPDPAATQGRPAPGPDDRAATGDLGWHLTREGDPAIRDHAMGGLSVLAFSASVALAAEATQRPCVQGFPIVLRDLEAVNWITLDGHSLDLRACTADRPDGQHVALAAMGMPPGFRARRVADRMPQTARSDAIPALATTSTPSSWTAERFYRDYAFHGPGYRLVDEITAIGADGCDALLRLRASPARATDQSAAFARIDPMMLDAAGQLVALWMLGQGGRSPSTGFFPVSAREVRIFRAMPPAGSVVDCRVRLRGIPGFGSEANAVFLQGGRPIACITALRQREVPLPPVLANWIFGEGVDRFTKPADGAELVLDLDTWRDAFAAQGGIWSRVIAHRILGPDALSRWLAAPDIDALLAQIAQREWRAGAPPDAVPMLRWEGGTLIVGPQVRATA
ncbi:acyltransferase domain-containing protein [Poseidonocella sedimentorum]|uniref:Malonyl CoA-acyl carrier protein transacylase n=1 Tax=Poseidonocella sedimentorum TaxID=871652 RepID=A0A1I6DL15_9RHOB|nr:acyltransferase domain-containing protein [Poseidonocella sedimentorum]SFR06136.1 Malonyl CoA-acyl carrier protein transacylase [Poseidonocella sedimentorum]